MIKKNRLLPLCKLFLNTTLIMLCLFKQAGAQSFLDKRVSVNFNHTRLAEALNEISKKAGFYFSYNGKALPKDSLVNLVEDNQKVAVLLNKLLHDKYEYEERKNYIIITVSLPHLLLINTDITNDNNTYSISGLVVDERNGERLMNASVYEKQQLVSTLTDEHGYFRLKFSANTGAIISLTASKRLYKDTSITLLQTVSVTSRKNMAVYNNVNDRGNRVERTGLGRLFISTRQKIQSLNIPDFFASRPFQVSLTPGLSSHGMFSPQVVNKFSLNLIGGYTAGVNGFELGGLFNINKRDSRYVQLAGIFNLAGGNVTGLQLAGVHNRALDTVKGVQMSIFTNNAGEQLSGLQISALHNETHMLKGLQIGLVNFADTSKGASIGLLNIIGNGFYKITYSASDISNTNISLKTGTHSFYSELLTSANISADQKFYSFGLGIGHDFMFSNKVYLSAETNYQFANTGSWDDRWTQGKLLLNVQLSKNISLVAGPTFNHYNHSGDFHIDGYKNITNVPEYDNLPSGDLSSGYVYYGDGHQTKNWVGWEAGITFSSVFKPAKRVIDDSQSWYLAAAVTQGIGWDEPYGRVSGFELSLQRDLGEHLTGTLSSGYTYISLLKRYSVDQFTFPLKIIPVKAGIRLRTAGSFFISGEVGESFGSKEAYVDNNAYQAYINNTALGYTVGYKPFHSFMYAASAGFSFKSGLETGIKFEDYGLQSQYKQFALRLGYRLKLSN
jgi:hypothetical protein